MDREKGKNERKEGRVRAGECSKMLNLNKRYTVVLVLIFQLFGRPESL